MNLSLAADLYWRELERREQLINATSLPAGILVVLGGLLGAVSTGFSYSLKFLTIPFIGPLATAAALFGIALVCLIRSHVGHSRGFTPTPATLKEHYDALLKHYQSRIDPRLMAESDFNDFMMRKLLEAAEGNTTVNDRKSNALHWSNLLLAWAILPTLLCAAIYVADT